MPPQAIQLLLFNPIRMYTDNGNVKGFDAKALYSYVCLSMSSENKCAYF